MPRYAPRQSSNASIFAIVAAAGVVGLGVVAVAGFIAYRQFAAREEPEVVVSEPAVDGTDQKASSRAREQPITPKANVQVPPAKTPAATPPVKITSAPTPVGSGRAVPTAKMDGTREKLADQKWHADMAKEINAARELPQVKEPIKAPLTTMAEYQRALVLVPRFKKQYPVEGPMPSYRLLLNADQSAAAAVLPETTRLLRREAFTQIARYDRPAMERLVSTLTATHPDVRLVLDNELYGKLHARLPWDERKTLYGRFQMLTGVKGEWSLLQPFDDLTGPEMNAAISAAQKLRTSGLRTLTPDERVVLYAAGAVDAVENALAAVQ